MKLGVIVDSKRVSKENYELLNWIQDQVDIELSLLIIQNLDSSITKARIQYGGIKVSLRKILFRFLSQIDKYLSSKINKKFNYKEEEFYIKNKFKEIILIKPEVSRSGYVFRYQKEDIEKIKNFDLDLLLRMGSGILRGEILNSCLYGILSFHHADNNLNRGGPEGFWEVFEKKESTGFTIQILTEELDGGNVLKKGNFHTQPTYSLNKFNLSRNSYLFMRKLLSEIAKNNSLPETIDPLPYSKKLYKVPSIKRQLSYLLYVVNYFLSKFYKRIILKKFFRWGVSFTFSNWKNAVLHKSISLKNPKNCFLADPFVIENYGRYFCFVENYSFIQKKGNISVYELENNKAKYLGESINEKFHLSYPFVFKYLDDFYMLPESSQNKDLRLYKSEKFPLEWKLERVLFENVNACDGTIFHHKDKWWLFVTKSCSDSLETNSQLFAYFSDNPVSSEWIEHTKNPVVCDSSSGRMGGLLTDENNIYLVLQKQGFNMYGKSSSIFRIQELTENDFEREYVCEITPDFSDDVIATHHFNSFKNCTVFDYLKEEHINF